MLQSSRAEFLQYDFGPRPEFRPSEPRGAGLSPSTLLARAWRCLLELRIDDALATVAQFEAEIARTAGPLAPRCLDSAEVLRAVLFVLKSQDDGTVRAAVTELRFSLHHARQRTGTALPPERVPRLTEALSPREHSILRSMSRGLSNKRIAQELRIAPETVKSHVKRIFIKLAVQTRAHAVSMASALGML